MDDEAGFEKKGELENPRGSSKWKDTSGGAALEVGRARERQKRQPVGTKGRWAGNVRLKEEKRSKWFEGLGAR